MKSREFGKLLSIAMIMLASSLALSQTLHKETLLGLHVITVELQPNITMDQFKNFFVKEVLPEYEKQWVGLKGYLVKSVRGEYKDRFAIIWVFDTEKARDRYFNADGSPNELEKAAIEAVKPIENKLTKYGVYTIKYMDDWVVQ